MEIPKSGKSQPKFLILFNDELVLCKVCSYSSQSELFLMLDSALQKTFYLEVKF